MFEFHWVWLLMQDMCKTTPLSSVDYTHLTWTSRTSQRECGLDWTLINNHTTVTRQQEEFRQRCPTVVLCQQCEIGFIRMCKDEHMVPIDISPYVSLIPMMFIRSCVFDCAHDFLHCLVKSWNFASDSVTWVPNQCAGLRSHNIVRMNRYMPVHTYVSSLAGGMTLDSERQDHGHNSDMWRYITVMRFPFVFSHAEK